MREPAGEQRTPGRTPITVEQLIARQGSEVGRRRAARTGDIPIPLAPGESLPAHRRGLPPVPREDDATPAPRRGLPPVPGADPLPGPLRPAGAGSRPGPGPAPAPGAGGQHPDPAPGGQHPHPVPGGQHPHPVPGGPVPEPLRGGLPPVPPSAVRHSVPLDPLPGLPPGHRPSRPVSPLPPIPGRDLPPAGASRVPPPSPRERRAARRAARSPARRRTTRVGWVALTAVLAVLGYHVGLYFYVDRSIPRVEAVPAQAPEVLAPQLQVGAVTYLVVGTDLPRAEGAAALAPLLVRLAPGGTRAVLVGIPPAALLDTPACAATDGTPREPLSETFAAALVEGGPGCAVRAVQQLSGLRVDHYLAVDLDRLPPLVDALGGVDVCAPATSAAAQPVGAREASGRSRLSGSEVAAFLAPADPPADPPAVAADRAELLLTAVLRAAADTGAPGDPVGLTRFLTRTPDALTVDTGTSLGDLRALAGALAGAAGRGEVERVDLPVADPGYLPAGAQEPVALLDRAATRTLFDRVIEGRPVGSTGSTGTDGVPPVEAAPPAPAVPEPAAPGVPVAPGEVTVDVLNGTATAGLAATAAEQLRAQGFGVGEVGNAPGGVAQTLVRHGAGAEEQARTVAAAVPGAVLEAADVAGVQLVLGPGYPGVVPVAVATATAAATGASGAADALAAPATEPVSSAAPVTCS